MTARNQAYLSAKRTNRGSASTEARRKSGWRKYYVFRTPRFSKTFTGKSRA
jgi:hypothetical protein